MRGGQRRPRGQDSAEDAGHRGRDGGLGKPGGPVSRLIFYWAKIRLAPRFRTEWTSRSCLHTGENGELFADVSRASPGFRTHDLGQDQGVATLPDPSSCQVRGLGRGTRLAHPGQPLSSLRGLVKPRPVTQSL